MTTTTFFWGTIGSVKHLLTDTELAPSGTGLAAATLSILGPEIDNTGGAIVGVLAVGLGSAAFVAGNVLEIYWLPSFDLAGGSYATLGTAAQMPLQNYRIASVGIKGTTAAQKEVYVDVRLPAGKGKCFAQTLFSTPTLANSGNSVDFYPTPVASG
jgi:hypothetical protein